MHTEVFDNIDLLVNMANSELNIDEANTELINVDNLIDQKKKDILDLKNLMEDSRYFNEANKLVDKNIEISLKNKINRLNRKLKELNNSNIAIKNDEKTIYQDITNLKELINNSTEYITSLNIDSNLGLKDIIAKEEKNKAELSKTLKEKEEKYNNILKELELNNQAILEMKSKIETLNSRLDDVIDSLNNPNTYIDIDLKEIDENKLSTLSKELDDLEKRKLELLTNASLIASDAKELIIKEDLNNALNKIKELVTIVKAKPYMDENNINILEEELDKKENYRKELVTIIDTKDYEESDNSLINARIAYLNKINDINNNKINEYDNLIKNIEEIINNELSFKINELEENIIKLEDNISKYRDLIIKKDNKDKANIENVLTKKEKQRKILNNLLKDYKEEMLSKINEIKNLKEIKSNLEQENTHNLDELTKLNKMVLLDTKVKDILLEEEDKAKLTNINEEIKDLKNRLKYTRSADEIYDEIDMALNIPSKNTLDNMITKNIENTITDDITSTLTNNINQSINIEDPITSNIDNIIKDTNEVLDVEPVKLKVVDVIPVGGQNGA